MKNQIKELTAALKKINDFFETGKLDLFYWDDRACDYRLKESSRNTFP